MKVGVPKEVKNHEYRVAITPIGVHELTAHGHEVLIEEGAGLGSQITDEEFVAAGARILSTADDVWATAEMVLKVKEPVAEEYHRMREGQTLFTYLHLAADKPLTTELLDRKVTGIAYETVQLPNGSLPLLYPMSEVAGCLAPQVGAHALLKAQGGRGVLLGGVGGVASGDQRGGGGGKAHRQNSCLGCGSFSVLENTCDHRQVRTLIQRGCSSVVFGQDSVVDEPLHEVGRDRRSVRPTQRAQVVVGTGNAALDGRLQHLNAPCDRIGAPLLGTETGQHRRGELPCHTVAVGPTEIIGTAALQKHRRLRSRS